MNKREEITKRILEEILQQLDVLLLLVYEDDLLKEIIHDLQEFKDKHYT